jgi:putative CocE/NonD family hydrolase
MAFPLKNPIAPKWRDTETRSVHVAMRDGVRLAVDLSLPRGMPAGTRLPALVAATRYWRARELRWPFSVFIKEPDSARDFFTPRGWALLRVDMRGTGASFGMQPHPWPARDLEDLSDLADWVVAQDWSDGTLGAFGNSYQATTAAMLCATGHPGVRSALVRFTEYDVYADIAFPGGVPNEFILRNWSAANGALDANRLPAGTPLLERLLVQGVKPVVPEDLPAAVADHALNGRVDSLLGSVVFRDDRATSLGVSLDEVSPMNRVAVRPVDAWGSWFDAATADAVIRRFVETDTPVRGVIGPWNHGGKQHVGAKNPAFPLGAQMLEALAYLAKPGEEKILHYWTVGEEAWQETRVWPPAGSSKHDLFLSGNGILAEAEPSTATVELRVDFAATTGTTNRWQTELDQRPVRYAPLDGRLSFTTAPLEAPVEITGYPKLTLALSSTHDDGAVFAYLEEIDSAGTISYLTEGMLRLMHRRYVVADPGAHTSTRTAKVGPASIHTFTRQDALLLVPGETTVAIFMLQPISVLVRAGSRLRLSLAGADRDTFARLPAVGDPRMQILLGVGNSVLEIPVMERS